MATVGRAFRVTGTVCHRTPVKADSFMVGDSDGEESSEVTFLSAVQSADAVSSDGSFRSARSNVSLPNNYPDIFPEESSVIGTRLGPEQSSSLLLEQDPDARAQARPLPSLLVCACPLSVFSRLDAGRS